MMSFVVLVILNIVRPAVPTHVIDADLSEPTKAIMRNAIAGDPERVPSVDPELSYPNNNGLAGNAVNQRL